MRRSVVFLLLVFVVVATPARAAAKSNEIGMIVPGEHVTFQSDIGMPSSDAAATAARVPHSAYIDRASGSGRAGATLAGSVTLRHLDPAAQYLRYEMSFVVPELAPGWYRVLICDAGCDHLLGGSWQGTRLRIVSSDVERDLRTLIKAQRYELEERINALRNEFQAEVDGRDIRLRYQASRALELARRIEHLEDRPIPSGGRAPASTLWLIGLGFAGGIAASALVARIGRRSLKWSAHRSIT